MHEGERELGKLTALAVKAISRSILLVVQSRTVAEGRGLVNDFEGLRINYIVCVCVYLH